MNDADKTREQLIQELIEIRQRIAELESQHTQAEEARWQQAQIISQIHDSVISTDLDGHVTSWNKGAENTFGYPAQEALGKHISFVYPESQDEFLQRNIIEPLKEKGEHEAEVRLRRASGEDFYAHLSLSLLRDSEGAVTGMIGYSMDITERKRAEAALEVERRKLQESETRLELAMRGADLGSWDWHVPTDEVKYSARATELLGYSPEEWEPHASAWEKLLHPDDAPRAREALNANFAGLTPIYESEHRLRTKSGEWRWVLARGKVVERDENGAPLRHAGTYLDITERKRTEEELNRYRNHLEELVEVRTAELRQEIDERKWVEGALSHQEAELRAILYSIGDAVITVDVESHVAWMNPVAEQLTGWTEAEAVGKLLKDVFCIINEETRHEMDPVARVLREGAAVGPANHTLLISKDGKEIPIADSSAPIFDPQGNITGVVLVFRDQTEERLAQRLIETRLTLIEYAANHTLGELLTQALDAIGVLVDSPIGFYHFVEPDQKTVSLQQWSTRTLNEFCQAEGKGLHYSIDQAGVWIDCVHEKRAVIHNDYASLPHKKGMPEGHAELIRELVVPVMREDKVVAILGVGNKPTDYTQRDVESVSYLADVTWEIVRQKQAEEMLQESEERYRTMTESSPIGIYVSDAERFIYVNPRLCEITGFSRDELLNMSDPVGRLLAREEREKVLDNALSRLEGESVPPSYEVRGIRKDGTKIMLGLTMTVMSFSGKSVLHGAVEDITERKRVEEKLRERERTLRSIFENMQDGYYRADMQGRILWATPSAAAMLGYDSPDEVIGCDIASTFYVHPEKREDFLNELSKTGRLSGYEVEVRRQDGDTIVVSTNIAYYRDEDGEIAGVEGAFRDVTKQKRAEKALIDERTLLNTILNNLPIQVYVKDTESRFVFANATTMRDLRVTTREEYMGKTDFDFMPQSPEKATAYLAEEQAIIRTGEAILNKEHASFTIDGVQKWSVTSKLPIHDTEGNITGIVGIGIDITERKQMEQRERELAVERERVKILGSFIQAASQEFRTPLSTINARLYLLERVTEPEKRLAQAKVIKEQTAYMGELVEAILTMASLESRVEFYFVPLDLNQLIRNVETRHRLWVEEKAISFYTRFGQLPLIHGDREQLQQALNNIIENAIDYTSKGGTVTILTHARGDFVVVEIKDTGVGISETDLPYIFDPFYRVDEARTARKAGLGLSIAHKIVEVHQGSLEVESELGKGSAFTITLPAKPPQSREVTALSTS